MLYHLLLAGVGILGLMAVWRGVQSLARRQSGESCDGPDNMACGSCAPERANHCHIRPVETDVE